MIMQHYIVFQISRSVLTRSCLKTVASVVISDKDGSKSLESFGGSEIVGSNCSSFKRCFFIFINSMNGIKATWVNAGSQIP